MKMLTVALLCAMMVLTRAAAVTEPEAEWTGPPIEEAAPEPEAEWTGPPIEEGRSHLVKRSTSCPRGWSRYRRRCFTYVPTPMTWADAERHCQYLGGNLASVRNLKEYHLIQSVILRVTHGYPLTWIGGSDAEQEGSWFWSDGTPFRFTYWAKGQPNNQGNEHCLEMNFGDHKKWNDQPCHDKRPFVCAKKP